MQFESSKSFAQNLDQNDPLRGFRDRFFIPAHKDEREQIYFCGNSLGLMPRSVPQFLEEETQNWQTRGVKGHTEGRHPWLPYHEFLTEAAATIVGAQPNEVVVMNTLTVNLHLLMISFYRPKGKRTKILIEDQAFGSDYYAVQSQVKLHNLDPAANILLAQPNQGEYSVRTDRILEMIETHHEELALIMLGGVQYYTGQLFELAEITQKAKQYDISVGFDLAHAAGNVELNLHDWGVDFAAWCHYKYLNSGPGAVAGVFIHEDQIGRTDLPRLNGWWGQNKANRFEMGHVFEPIPTAEAWQISNPPILSMSPIRASQEIFLEAGGMQPLRQKSIKLTGFLAYLLKDRLSEQVKIITPEAIDQRGAQLSLEVSGGKEVHEKLENAGVISDWRHPNVIRVAPVPLYNTFGEVWDFVQLLGESIGG